MKFWKKQKKKFRENKVYRMLIILAAACQIGAIVFTVLAGFQKDMSDELEKEKASKDLKTIKKNTEETNFNTSSARFFQENDNNFEKYSKFFEYGFYVYHHSKDFKKPFKKAYGSKIHVEYIEYSNANIRDPEVETEDYQLLREVKYKKVAGNRNFSNLSIGSNIGVSIDYVGKVQMLRGIGEYGKPYYNFCDYFVLLSHEKPFTYAIGPQDCDFFKENN